MQLAKHVGVLMAGGVLSIACMGEDGVAGGKVDGPKIYKEACARCHGSDGTPKQARTGVKPLTSERAKKMSDEELLAQIRNGSKNRMMPAFQGAMSDEQMKALVAHIRTLQGVGSTAKPAPKEAPKPEVPKPEAPKPEAPKPEAAKPATDAGAAK